MGTLACTFKQLWDNVAGSETTGESAKQWPISEFCSGAEQILQHYGPEAT